MFGNGLEVGVLGVSGWIRNKTGRGGEDEGGG